MAREGVAEGVVGYRLRARLSPHAGNEDGRQKRRKCNYDQSLEHDRQHSFRRDVTLLIVMLPSEVRALRWWCGCILGLDDPERRCLLPSLCSTLRVDIRHGDRRAPTRAAWRASVSL